MASSPAPERLIQLFPRHQPWPRGVFASSVALHALGFALVGWVTHGTFRTLISASSQHITRAYATYYLVLRPPPTNPGPRPEQRMPSPHAPVAPARPSAIPAGGMTVMASPSRSVPLSPPVTAPSRPVAALQSGALAPGVTVGIGQIVATPSSDSTGGRGLAGMLGFRGPTTDVEPASRGLDRLPELVGGTGSACPELRPAAASKQQFPVAVAFVVDTNGRVDRATLEVVESPGQARTDRRFHARVYVVGASGQVDPGKARPVADDAVLTEEVASHVAGLVFLPALREGRVIRSTVLVSCQTS